MYHHDWVMRQIQLLVAAISKLLFGKNILIEEAEPAVDAKLRDLTDKLKRKGVCGAEDQLLEEIDPEDIRWLEIALRFYDEVNKLADAQLESQNFTREEIKEGIIRVCEMYGMNCAQIIG